MYKEPDYADSRLRGTIVRLDGEPVYVKAVGGNMNCIVCGISNDGDYINERGVYIDDLDLKSPPLGYVNYNGRAHYLTRKPLRNDWRQGLRRGNVYCLSGGGNDARVIMACVKGEFPTYTQAINKLKDGLNSIAISRDFKLSRRGDSISLCYKWYGKIASVDGDLVKVGDEYKFLLNRIKEVIKYAECI